MLTFDYISVTYIIADLPPGKLQHFKKDITMNEDVTLYEFRYLAALEFILMLPLLGKKLYTRTVDL